jgi:hypothetical protein
MNDTTQQKVLDNLVTLYQSKGLSPEKLFQNQMFLRLPIEQKIAMVKKYGEQNGLGKGNGVHWDMEDAKTLLLGLGLTALTVAAGKGLLSNWEGSEGIPVADRITRIAGPSLGLVGAALGASSRMKEFSNVYSNKKGLYGLDTTNDNAIIGYLANHKYIGS